VLGALVQTTGAWASIAGGVVDDATSLFGMVQDVSGTAGRFASGAATGFLGAIQSGAPQTLAASVASGIADRADVRALAASVGVTAAGGGALDTANAVQALSGAVLSSMRNPSDALRLF
jgi:hypothetical protein